MFWLIGVSVVIACVVGSVVIAMRYIERFQAHHREDVW